jgi:putative membrane protein
MTSDDAFASRSARAEVMTSVEEVATRARAEPPALGEVSSTLVKGSSTLAEGASTLVKGSSTLADGSSTLAEGSSTLVTGSSTLAEGSLSGGSSLKTTLKTGSATTSGVRDVVLSTCMQGGSAATSGVSQAGADRGGASARDGASAHGGAFLSELRKRMFPKTRAPK